MTKRFKIEPDLTCHELAGYKLPEVERGQEDEAEGMAKEEFNNIDKPIRSGVDYHSYKVGFVDGYTKAREKFEFTKQDLINFTKWVENSKEAAFYDRKNRMRFEPTMGGNPESEKRMPELLELYLNRHPIAIEVEMEYYYMSSVKLYGKDAGWVKCDKIQFDGIKESIPTCPLKEIPATNPDGTVKVRWVYE